jgi:hypothetical protein
MALALSPRKIVPLASGEDRKHHRTNSTVRVTKRVFFCGVVVEGSENGRTLREGMLLVYSRGCAVAYAIMLSDVQDLVVSLGVPLDSGPDMNASLNGRPDVVSIFSPIFPERWNSCVLRREERETFSVIHFPIRVSHKFR